MENLGKSIKIKNTRDGRTTSMTLKAFTNLKSQPEYPFWVNEGYESPEGVISCWYVDENERLNAIKHQRPYCDPYVTSIYFKVSNRIDSLFIEGYMGRTDHEEQFHSEFASSLTYFIDYKNRKKIYFTFDKISLYQVMEISPGNPLKFLMKRIDNQKSFKTNQAFMIIPFHNEKLDALYNNYIKPLMKEKFNVEIYRADDFRDNDIIIDTIHELIEESEFIIADTTVNNKNAFYELGYASHAGKEIIMIQNKTEEQKLFFDGAHIRTIMYNEEDMETLQFDLEQTIKSIRSRQ